MLKTLFVTNPEAHDEFEQEKEVEVEEQVGSSVRKVDVRQGWGEWAGHGVDMSKNDAKKAKLEQQRKDKIEELKKKRVDSKMRGV